MLQVLLEQAIVVGMDHRRFVALSNDRLAGQGSSGLCLASSVSYNMKFFLEIRVGVKAAKRSPYAKIRQHGNELEVDAFSPLARIGREYC
jgi:hypothetical protein